MMPYCCVATCSFRSFRKSEQQLQYENEKEKVGFFSFPKKNKQLLYRWRTLINNFQSSNFSVICSRHFRTEDYENHFYLNYFEPEGRRRLKPDAVPSLHLPDHQIVSDKTMIITDGKSKNPSQSSGSRMDEDDDGSSGNEMSSVSESNGKADSDSDDGVLKNAKPSSSRIDSDSDESQPLSARFPRGNRGRGRKRGGGPTRVGGWSRRGRPGARPAFVSDRKAEVPDKRVALPKTKTAIIKMPRLDAILGLELLNVPLGHLYMSIDSFNEAYMTYLRENEKKTRLRPRRQTFATSYRELDEFSSCSEYVPTSESEAEAEKPDSPYELSSSDEDWTIMKSESRAPARRRGAGRRNRTSVQRSNLPVRSRTKVEEPMTSGTTTVSLTTKSQLTNILSRPIPEATPLEKMKHENEMREFVTKIMNGDCIYKDFVIWLNLNPLTMIRLECSPNTLPPTKSFFRSLQINYKKIYCALCAGTSPEESKLLEDYEDWLRHWREEHNMSRNIHCCKCSEKFGCFPEFLHHMMTAKGGRTPHSALNCAYLYETVFLAASPNNENWFRCPRDNCTVEGSSFPVLSHMRLNHRNLGFTLSRCDLAPCESHPLKSVSDLVDHLRKNHESLLMDDTSCKRAEMNILAHRSKSREERQPKIESRHATATPANVDPNSIPNRGRPSNSALNRTSNVFILPKTGSNQAGRPSCTGVMMQTNADELYICGVCKAENNAVSLMTCHQQHAHTFRMPVHCNKCSMPMPQLWSLIKQHYEKGHGMVFQTSRLLPFVYKRPVYFLRNLSSNRSMCSRCRASVLVGGELEHTCASDNKWHATGPPSRCGLCSENFMDYMTMIPVRNHYLRVHGVCIVCLQDVPDRTIKECPCEKFHWEKEENEKQKLLAAMVNHIDVLKLELEKKSKRSDPQPIMPPSRGRKTVERIDVSETTIKEAKRILFVLDTNKYREQEEAEREKENQLEQAKERMNAAVATKLSEDIAAAGSKGPEMTAATIAAATEPLTTPKKTPLEECDDFLYNCLPCRSAAMSLSDFVTHRQRDHNSCSASCPCCPEVRDIEAEKAREHILKTHPDVGNFLPSQWPPSWHPFLPAPPANQISVSQGPPISPEGPVFCLYCRQFAGSFHQLLIHMATCHHSAALRFRCPEPCLSRDLYSLAKVQEHVQQMHLNLKDGTAGSRARYVCLSCDVKLLNNFVESLTHLRTVHGMRDFFFHCPVCPFLLLGGERTLKLHLRRYHGAVFAEAYERGSLPVHFENMENLVAAVDTSKGLNNAFGTFLCAPCGRKDVWGADGILLAHTQGRHRGKNAMTCPVCREMFLERQKLRVHVDGHVKNVRESDIVCQLRWVCQIGDCSFSVKHVLRDMILHAETVHGLTPESGEMILRCPFCSWLQSPDMNAIIRHLRIFHLVGLKKLGVAGISIQPVSVRGKCTDDEMPFRCVVENVRQPLKDAGAEEDDEINNIINKRRSGRVKESAALKKTTAPPPVTYELSSDDDDEEETKEQDNSYKVPVVSKFNLKGYENLSWDSEEGINLLASILMDRSSNGQPFNIPDPQYGYGNRKSEPTKRRRSDQQPRTAQLRQKVETDAMRIQQVKQQHQMEEQQRRQQIQEAQKRLQPQQTPRFATMQGIPGMQLISDPRIPQQLVQIQPGQVPHTPMPILVNTVDPRAMTQLAPQSVQFLQRGGNQDIVFAPTITPGQANVGAQGDVRINNQMLR